MRRGYELYVTILTLVGTKLSQKFPYLELYFGDCSLDLYSLWYLFLFFSFSKSV